MNNDKLKMKKKREVNKKNREVKKKMIMGWLLNVMTLPLFPFATSQ